MSTMDVLDAPPADGAGVQLMDIGLIPPKSRFKSHPCNYKGPVCRAFLFPQPFGRRMRSCPAGEMEGLDGNDRLHVDAR
jgi:hypothetical protein